MAKTERIREAFDRPLDLSYLRERERAGWRLVGLEWEREVEGDDARTPQRAARSAVRLPSLPRLPTSRREAPEMQFLFSMMELIIQDISLTKVAEELNKKGYRTRKGTEWGPVAVFNMLPRLIEVTPRILGSEEWVERRKRLSLVY